MPAFAVVPYGPNPPDTDEGFPQFIQWQYNGVNLGGPDVDTVNVLSPLVVTVSGTTVTISLPS